MGRAKGQKTMTVSLSEQLLMAMDFARKDRTRSEFTREALAEFLAKVGSEVESRFLEAPSRRGKGGQPSHKKRVVLRDPIATEEISAPGKIERGPLGDDSATGKAG